jgi:hypothetical protein
LISFSRIGRGVKFLAASAAFNRKERKENALRTQSTCYFHHIEHIKSRGGRVV